jgi:hypothetical protein
MRISKAKTPLLVIIIGAAESTRAASKSPQVAGLLGETLTTIVTRLMKEERELRQRRKIRPRVLPSYTASKLGNRLGANGWWSFCRGSRSVAESYDK